jgi:hypothetical protein
LETHKLKQKQYNTQVKSLGQVDARALEVLRMQVAGIAICGGHVGLRDGPVPSTFFATVSRQPNCESVRTTGQVEDVPMKGEVLANSTLIPLYLLRGPALLRTRINRSRPGFARA